MTSVLFVDAHLIKMCSKIQNVIKRLSFVGTA